MAQNPFYVDPGNNYSSGLNGLSSTLSNIRQDRIAQAEQKRKQDQYDRAQKRFEEVQGAAMKAFDSNDPDLIARTSIQYPEITQMLRDTAGLKDDIQNRDALEFTRAFATADDASRPGLYEQRIKQIQDRGGDPSHTIQSYQEYQQNPDAETRDVISYWAGIDPKGYSVYSDQQKAAQKAALEQQKFDQQQQLFQQAEAGRNQRAAIRNSISRANGGGDKGTAHMKDYQQYQELLKSDPEGAKAFGQAAGFVSKEGRELTGVAQQRLSLATDEAVQAENNVSRYQNLAEQIEKSDLKGGVYGGSLKEKLKELTGNQDALTDLRREVGQLRNSQAAANLPRGPASDTDVKMALGPLPTDNANKTQIASWLRGVSKLQQINADYNNFKADFISERGTERGMLQAWKDRNKQVSGESAGNSAQPFTKPAAASGGWEIIQ